MNVGGLDWTERSASLAGYVDGKPFERVNLKHILTAPYTHCALCQLRDPDCETRTTSRFLESTYT